jgi:hypothetical protein
MQSHWQRNKEIADKSRHILANAPPTRDEATSKIQTLKVRWDQLREESDKLARWLSEAEQASQYFQVTFFLSLHFNQINRKQMTPKVGSKRNCRWLNLPTMAVTYLPLFH